MVRRFVLVLLMFALVVLAAGVHAETLVCPYDVDTSDGIVRRLSLNRDAIVTALKLQTGLDQPWTYQGQAELEVQGNRALVELNLAALTPALVSAITGGGADCQIVADAVLPTVKRQARAPRIVGGQLHFDHADTSRALISPRTFRVAWRESPLKSILAFLGIDLKIPRAYALGTFPDPGTIIDNFNRADVNPIGSPWFEFDTNENSFQIATNELDCPTAACHMYYDETTATDADAFVRLNTIAANKDIGLRGRQPGAATNDGYSVRNAGGASDALRRLRWDNGSAVQIGTDCAQVDAINDLLGIRVSGGIVSAYFKDEPAAWALICESDEGNTYPTAGFVFLRVNETGGDVEDFGFTQFASTTAAPKRRKRVFN